MKEYIVPIYDDGRDDDSIFVGEIREKATEVVRCKDCIYWNERETNKKGFVVCKATHMDCTEDDYCSFGEKVTE